MNNILHGMGIVRLEQVAVTTPGGERMKNIQVIDSTINSVYDIFQATEEEFSVIFPADEDVAYRSERQWEFTAFCFTNSN